MFDNIGGKIKKLAVVLAVLGIIASVICAIVVWTTGNAVSRNNYYYNYNYNYSPYGYQTSAFGNIVGFWGGLLVLVGGSLGSWITSWWMYAFGSLVEDMEQARFRAAEIRKSLSNGNGGAPGASIPQPIAASAGYGQVRCPSCDTPNDRSNATCKMCGMPLHATSASLQPRSATPPKKACPSCGAMNKLENTECFACGAKFPE